MRKIAIFVEGQTELIFVRDFLLNWYEYVINLECRRLLADDNISSVPYDSPNPTASIHIQIIDAGGDNKVLSRILRREKFLVQAGYEKIIGLRDMYSENYKEIVQTRTVDLTVIERFRQGVKETVRKESEYPNLIYVCFAIMEIEAWWLGIPSLWDGLDVSTLTEYQAAFDEPEKVFHPMVVIDKLLKAKRGTGYSKNKSDVESIVGQLRQEHYAELHDSQRVPSFCEFVQYVQFN